jgi:hypothetical protein
MVNAIETQTAKSEFQHLDTRGPDADRKKLLWPWGS